MKEEFTFRYEKFYLSCQLDSKINLYVRAEEIAVKKYFFSYYKKQMERSGREEDLAGAIQGADAFYAFFLQNYQEKIARLYGESIRDWQESQGSEAGFPMPCM